MPTKESIDSFLHLIDQSCKEESLISLTASDPWTKSNVKKVSFKALNIKGKYTISKSYLLNNQQFTESLQISEFKNSLVAIIENYKQLNAKLKHQNLQLLINKKREGSLKKRSTTNKEELHHNKQKSYLIPPDASFLHKLDLSTKDGKIKDKAQKKFRQINKFIEVIKPHFESLPDQAHIYDFGCGKGYLTFAMDEYFNQQLNKNFTIKGIDLKKDLILNIQKLATNRPNLQFVYGDINKENPKRIDALIALHACDTATDIAIAKAIKKEAQLIVVAPCCQKQIRKEMASFASSHPMLKHGILLERQASLLTDSIRALIMESKGYKTKVFEFITTEHTAKNIMIIGQKTNVTSSKSAEISQLKAQFGIREHALEKLLN